MFTNAIQSGVGEGVRRALDAKLSEFAQKIMERILQELVSNGKSTAVVNGITYEITAKQRKERGE